MRFVRDILALYLLGLAIRIGRSPRFAEYLVELGDKVRDSIAPTTYEPTLQELLAAHEAVNGPNAPANWEADNIRAGLIAAHNARKETTS